MYFVDSLKTISEENLDVKFANCFFLDCSTQWWFQSSSRLLPIILELQLKWP